MPKDPVLSVLDLVRAAAPELSEEKLGAIASTLAEHLGGKRIYFGKAPAQGKALRLGGAIAAGASLEQAFAAAGVSETYGYKLLRRRWRVR